MSAQSIVHLDAGSTLVYLQQFHALCQIVTHTSKYAALSGTSALSLRGKRGCYTSIERQVGLKTVYQGGVEPK